MPLILLGILLMSIVSTSAIAANEPLVIGPAHVDAVGITHYPLQSCYQRRMNSDGTPAYTDLRIIEPRWGVDAAARFLYVLPVQPGTPQSMEGKWTVAYGDGIAAMKALDIANTYNLVVVEPDFNAVDFASKNPYQSGPAPWYGDSPIDPQVRQESYLINDVIPAVDRMYPHANHVRMLIGYSKSGWGAISLLLRHPEMFAGVAAFDAPLMITEISPPHYANENIVFGHDNAYFQKEYRLDNHVKRAAARINASRIWIGMNAASPLGPPTRPYVGDFPRQSADFTKVLDTSGIPNTVHWQHGPVSHSWSPTNIGGKEVYWEAEAIAFLMK